MRPQIAASEGNAHVLQLLLKHGASAFATDRWGNHPLADALREGHAHIASLLRGGMDSKIASEEGVAEFAHMEAVRNWLVRDAGLRDGQGLHGVLELLDAQGVDSVELLDDCWLKLEPMIKVGPASRVSKALRSRNG